MRKTVGVIAAAVLMVVAAPAVTTAFTLVVASAANAYREAPSKSPREKWAAYQDKALPRLNRIDTDFQSIANAQTDAQPGLGESLLRLRCLSLEEEVNADYKVLTHSPDQKLDKLLKTTLSAYVKGAQECKQQNFSGATRLFALGTSLGGEATARVQVLTAKYG